MTEYSSNLMLILIIIIIRMQHRKRLPAMNSILVGRIFGLLFRYSRVITPALSPSSSFVRSARGGGTSSSLHSPSRGAHHTGQGSGGVDVVLMLGEMLTHQNKRIQRAAAASLAELTFYVFNSWELERSERAEAEKEGGALLDELDELEQWYLSRAMIMPLLRALQPSRDPIVRHYVAKLIENVASQSDFRNGLDDILRISEVRGRFFFHYRV